VDIADLFVGSGPLAVVTGRAFRPIQRFDGKDGDSGEFLKVVVLVDGRTASATELVSLILRERLKAPLLGVTTYGKGSVQKLLPVEGGGYLKITSAMYSTAAGTTVGDGIAPDVTLDERLSPTRGKEGSLETDPWLKAAYDAMPLPPGAH
jgi:carboxyl-terminal processing protease